MSAKSITRLEMFSDAVFAIAATLLILEIKIPHAENGEMTPAQLWHELMQRWPSYFAFALSFGSIFIIWQNYHYALNLIDKTSNAFIYANGLLLLIITFLPFPTALLASHINTPTMVVGVAVYNASSALVNLAFNLAWECTKRPVYLLKPEVTVDMIAQINMKTRIGFILYIFATVISFWFPIIGISITSALYLLWITLSLGEQKQAV